MFADNVVLVLSVVSQEIQGDFDVRSDEVRVKVVRFEVSEL